LPHTIASVEIGASISTSRLPRNRSSPSAVGARTESSMKPSTDCRNSAAWIVKLPLSLWIS
jgi:hypothetical protein